MRFVDTAKITVHGGHGGAGVVHWRREAHIPRGGPDGGNGGNGGAVIFLATSKRNTLIEFAFVRNFKATDGKPGDGTLKDGKAGKDLLCEVPIGTQVYHKGELIADLSQENARWVAAAGGNGGKGNTFFKSATNQSPDYAQPGQPGQSYEFELVLKSIADVGLLGFPNAGKSTLISAISAARPKIADYEFTTLEPNLGVVRVDDKSSYVVADIPGLIPGAHLGKGLGIKFLKHIERTKALCHLIDPTRSLDEEGNPSAELLLSQLEDIENELAAYSEALLNRPRLIVVSKADLPVSVEAFEMMKLIAAKRGLQIFLVSSATAQGLEELKFALYQLASSADKTSNG